MLHIYWGDGKGKTTAAMGLALRALGHGWKVSVAQFLKNGSSGELEILRQQGAAVRSGMNSSKFTWQMTDEEKLALRDAQTAMLQQLLEEPWDLLVLDEVCDAWDLELVDHEALRALVETFAAERELVLTGRKPAPWLQERADYVTRMVCCAHPFQKGKPARIGVEY